MRNAFRRGSHVVLAALALLAAPAPGAAQTLYGSIVGTVTDPQGGVMPGVAVVATNTGTDLKVEARTDGTGSYILRNLLPGTYDLTATLSGFRQHDQKGIPVEAGNPVRINITMTVGAMAEHVEVVSSSTPLQTEKADRSTVITSKDVTNMPLNQYRNYQTLINLVPGATPAQFQNAEIDTPGRSLRTWVNGTQPNSNATRIDGAVSVNIWLPHHVGYIQPAETIDTVNISTNTFDADQGMAAGSSTTVVTKSGTNELRGSAFGFYNSDKLNANSLSNNANGLAKPPLSHSIYGGTIGGPIVKNRFFYFGSWEHLRDRRSSNATYNVPTAKMRTGDFSEVAAAYSAFRLFNPATGGAGGTNRDQFTNFQIPGNLISSIAKSIMAYYPMPNAGDLDRNGLLDDFTRVQTVMVDRDNYDTEFTYQRTPTHSIWGKFSMLNADVVDNYILGFDNGSLGHTRVYVGTAGHTWTLGPSLVLDGNFGLDIQKQNVRGPDFGDNLGLDLGIKGVNDENDIRASGLPNFQNGYPIGTTPNWMPLDRDERTYTFSSALTKSFGGKHDVRVGVDVVRLELTHRQAEFGDYGLRGGFSFDGRLTGAAGYTQLQWNRFADFLLSLPNFYSKDVQTEPQTGREWQSAIYIRERWNASRKLTLSGGLRAEFYPLMRRADRGLERLDYSTYTVLIGGKGDVPLDAGIHVKTAYLAPRVGAAYRLTENSVFRAGYGRTINPLPWSRPMRGSFPQDINFNATAEQFTNVTTLEAGIPPVPIPDISSGHVKLPQGVFMRSPNPNQVNRGTIQQWNVAYEYLLPWDISTEIAYVGTRTDGGYADLNINYGTPGGGNPSRQYFAQAGTTAINDWAARTKSRYKALQVSVNRQFRRGLALKGAYTLSKAQNMADEDGWVGLDYNSPLVYNRSFALAGFDRTHVFQMGAIYDLPFGKDATGVMAQVVRGWQVNSILGAFSGSPYSIGGTNNPLNCPGCGSIRIDISGDPKPIGEVGSSTQTYYDKSLFSQPTGVDVAGFGNSGRNRFRRPPVWNLDFSAFKRFSAIGRVTPELRIESANFFNHPNWGAPVTSFTANNFLLFTPGSYDGGGGTTNTPGPRRFQIGLRVTF